MRLREGSPDDREVIRPKLEVTTRDIRHSTGLRRILLGFFREFIPFFGHMVDIVDIESFFMQVRFVSNWPPWPIPTAS